MNLNKLLSPIALLTGICLGCVLFYVLRSNLPSPLTDASSGAFTPSQLSRRLFLGLCLWAGWGGAASAWLGRRASDWDESSPLIANLLLAIGMSGAATGLGAAFMSDAPKALLWTLPMTGPLASLGAALSWWYAGWDSVNEI